MILQPFYTSESGCAAYIVGSGGKGKCAVVDGHKDDVERYLAFASAEGMAITHVIDTHVHADHVRGDVCPERTGALYCLHASAVVAFAFTPIEDGQQIELGNVRRCACSTRPGTRRRASASWSPTLGAAPIRGSC